MGYGNGYDTTVPHEKLGKNTIFLVPQDPLEYNTQYHVRMAGTDREGVDFDHSWSFTTRSDTENTSLTARVTSSPSNPKAGDEVTFIIDVINDGEAATNAHIVASLPNDTTYVASSAATTHGTVTVDGSITFAVGRLEVGETATLSFKVKVSEDIMSSSILSNSLSVTWDGGNSVETITTIVNANTIFLPVVVR